MWQHYDNYQQPNPPPFCLFLAFKRHFLLFPSPVRYSSAEPGLYTVPVQLQGGLTGKFAQKMTRSGCLGFQDYKNYNIEWSTNRDGY